MFQSVIQTTSLRSAQSIITTKNKYSVIYLIADFIPFGGHAYRPRKSQHLRIRTLMVAVMVSELSLFHL